MAVAMMGRGVVVSRRIFRGKEKNLNLEMFRKVGQESKNANGSSEKSADFGSDRGALLD